MWRSLVFFAVGAVGAAIALDGSSRAAELQPPPCNEDAMIVFDASGSMAGNVDQGIATIKPRIDEARRALSSVLPHITRFRRVGLITYGPGAQNQCNVQLKLGPTVGAAERIMREVNAWVPAGRTPLTSAVDKAAVALDYRIKPGVIVVLTDGEETCGKSPCELGKLLHASAAQLTVHVISYRTQNYSWVGEGSVIDTRCLAEQNGGLYITAKTQDEIADAFARTLGCPMISEHEVRSSAQATP
jgi:Ca-activated chloride channel family protein